jgi:hypothetical protein
MTYVPEFIGQTTKSYSPVFGRVNAKPGFLKLLQEHDGSECGSSLRTVTLTRQNIVRKEDCRTTNENY